MAGHTQPSFFVDDQSAGDDDTRLEDHPHDRIPADQAPTDQRRVDPPASLPLELTVRDPAVVEALCQRAEGRQRDAFALDAMRIGVMALRHASSQVDADLVRNASAELLGNLQQTLETHATLSHKQTTAVLTEYFDPKSGKLSERVGRLVSDDGELARLLRGQLNGEASPLARTLHETLGKHVGGDSPLMKLLDPEQAKGVVASLQRTVDAELAKQREHVLREFSLDNRKGALRRLVDELHGKHGELGKDLQGKIDEVVKEFSLDKEDSALSRLVANVDRAQRTISSEFSLDNELSGLSRLKQELLGVLSAHVKTNAEFQEEVKVALARLTQKRQSDAEGTEHGNVFEEAVHEFLDREAQSRGDIAEATGATTGAIKGRKVGDTVVTLGPDTPSAGCRIVYEAKDEKNYTLQKALDEIELARKNRRADVGVFVFGSESAPPGLRPLSRFRNDIVVVWNAEDATTDAYLLAAIEIARACSIEFHRGADTEEVDLEGIEKAVNAVEKRSQDLEKIRKPAQTIQNASGTILEEVRKGQDDLARQVKRLRDKTAALRSAGDA